MSRFLLHKSILFMLCLVGLQNLNAQESLIKDINPGVGWASIDVKFRTGDKVYFVANSDLGNELWVSDGTPNGTDVLKDINTGAFDDANPANFIQYNGTWYFTADDGENGIELWKTDGTESGTVLFVDIYDGIMSADPMNLVIINGLLYFSANDGINGRELWKSDGTVMGTSMVADVFTGTSGSSPEYMVDLGTDIVFVANNGTNGKELWKTDGTAPGTTMIKDIIIGASSSFPTDLTTVASKVYFIADDGVNGKEVWRTDGTEAGTELTTDIVVGPGHPQARDLIAVGNFLFFVADDGTSGIELFRSDANAAPLSEIVEIFADTFGSTPKEFMKLNGDLIFNANSGGAGFELWKANASDGSVAMIKDIFPGFGSSSPVMLDVLNNELLFKARGELIGFELWKTDGTDAGTVLLGDLNTDPSTNLSNSSPTLPVIKDNIMYFSATDYINGYQIWRTDGTSSSTQRLTSIPHDTIFNNSHKPYFIHNIGNEVINFVGLSDPYGEELWGFEVDPVSISSVQTNSPLNCNGDANGTINIIVTGGVGDTSCFTYNWSNGSLTGLNITDLTAGSYTLTVSDCVGFETITTVTIEEPEAVIGITMETSQVSCTGDSDGQASASGAGGNSPYNYLWDNGQTGPSVTGLDAGIHSVTITDNNGCTGEETVLITEPTAVTAFASAGPEICSGATNGSATVVPGGGTPGYNYLWDNGEVGETAFMLSGGSHSATVTDANGCSIVATVFIAELPVIAIDFINQDVSCINGNNGASSAIPTGGSGTGYTYLWEDGSTSINLTDLVGGSYAVTITDDNGCTSVASTTILTPIVSVSTTGTVSCFGGSDGTASVSIDNANSTYTYLWDNGESTATATMLSEGVHTVTITDALACTAVETVTIIEMPEFIFADSLSASPSCFGADNGFVTYNFSGGTAPYTYTWSTGDVTSTGTLTGLSGDATYCATVTDANNCATFNFCSTLTEPTEISTNLTDLGSIDCFGVCDGTASIAIAAGEPGASYTFTWSSGETNVGTTSTAIELCAGLNAVTISDGTCSIVESIPFGGPEQIIPTIVVTDASCFGEADGGVSASAIGGTGALGFEFSNGETNLLAGNYSITITDANACQLVESFTVGQPDLITLTYNTHSPSCIGASDGNVTPIPAGGTGPFSFEYSDGSIDLAAGTYMITATDANGCQAFDSFTIEDPDPIQITSTVNDISCFGETDGSVTAAAIGGSAPYSFEYSDGATDLAVGTYMVTATDDNGCVVIDSFTVSEPDLLVTEVMTNDVSCFGGSDGAVNTTATGGTMPYLFSYSDGIDDLSAGTYFVTTTDNSGCENIDTFNIVEPSEALVVTSTVTNVSCFGESDGTVVVEGNGGNGPYEYDYSGGSSDLAAGTYTVTVTDASGCVMIDTFMVTEPTELTLSTSTTAASGSLTDGTATAVANGGTMPYTYEWNTTPAQLTETATGLAMGNYEVTVTDANGCTIAMMAMVDMIDATVDLDERLSFDLYPNPADEVTVVDLEFLETFDVELIVFDVLGQTVYSKSLGSVRSEEVALDISSYTQGVYWVQVKTGAAQFVRKLSVIKR